MEIVVNDTNILIDLYNSGLLSYCNSLNVDFRTLDVVLDEIVIEAQREEIQSIVDSGYLRVYSLSGKQMSKVLEMMADYKRVCNLSFQDISVLIYAKDNGCRLLTGDKTLRDKAVLENVKVSGILYLTDLMISEEIIPKKEMAEALRRLIHSNSRLPRKLIEERIYSLLIN